MDNNTATSLIQQPCRPPSIEIDASNVDLQSNFLLFSLPAELRQQIYENVIGSGQIHVIMRSCSSTDSPIRTISTSSESHHDLTMHDYQKLTYSTCHNPLSFPTRYLLSKKSGQDIPIMYFNSHGHLPYFPGPETHRLILPNWAMEHAECYSAPQKDMVLQQYSSVQCAQSNRYTRHDTRNCPACATARAKAETEYGPPTATQGLKRLHQNSAVTVDGLLRSCKRVYFETRLLPFQSYTFDIHANLLCGFTKRWLEPWQVATISHVHIELESTQLGGVGGIFNTKFTGLKRLEVEAAVERGQTDGSAWERERLASAETVEVVVGFDFDRKYGRRERRREAGKVEWVLGNGKR